MEGYQFCSLYIAIYYFADGCIKGRVASRTKCKRLLRPVPVAQSPITILTITISHCLPTDCPMIRDGRWHRHLFFHCQCWNLLNHPMTCHPNRHLLQRRSASNSLSLFLLQLSLVLYMYVSFCCLLFVLRKSFHLYLIITFTVVPLLIWRMFTPSCKSSMRMPPGV